MKTLPAVLAATMIVLAPLPFGSSHAWSVSAIDVTTFLLVGLLFAVEDPSRIRSRIGSLAPAAGLLFAYLCCQMVPLPPTVLGAISASRAALYAELLDDAARWLPLSLDAHASLLSLTRLAAYAGVFVIAAVAPLPRRGNLFTWTILVAGSIAAAVAWIHLYRGWDTLLYGRFPSLQGVGSGGRLSWPFVNPNHLATTMNLCWPLALALLIAPTPWLTTESRWSRAATRVAAALLLTLLLATLVGTRSKGGLAAAIAAPVAMALAWPLRRAVARPARIGVVVTAAGVLTAAVFAIAIDVVQHPAPGVEMIALARRDATLRVRLEAVAQSLLMLRDFPIFGTGLGAWGETFPMYQRYPLLSVDFVHAHDDYVQWVEETGIAGLIFAAILAVTYFAGILRPLGVEAARKRAALLGALATVATQSVIDFGVRMPANAVIVSAILGMLWRETTSVYAIAREARAACFGATPHIRSVRTVFGLAVVCLAVRFGMNEWIDSRAFAAAEQGELAPRDSNDCAVLEHAAWTMPRQGLPNLDLAAAAVAAAPIVAAPHRTLAYAYRSVAMREQELRRAIRCAPAFDFFRIDLSRLLLATGRGQAALREIERTFYENPNVALGDVASALGVAPDNAEFRAAAGAGLERRAREWPELADAARRLEGGRRE
jgi:putative inorganic carbon (hco3(-)) transporter